MAQKVYLFLDAAGTDEVIDVMTDLGDEVLTQRIITDPEQLEADDAVASAKLIYDAFAQMQKTLDDINTSILDIRSELSLLERRSMLVPYQKLVRHEVVYGPIYSSVLYPREDTVYFQKDSISDKYWDIWFWNAPANEWFWIDTTEPYIDYFWHKNETDALIEAIGFVEGPNWVVMPFDRIRRSVEIAFSVFA